MLKKMIKCQLNLILSQKEECVVHIHQGQLICDQSTKIAICDAPNYFMLSERDWNSEIDLLRNFFFLGFSENKFSKYLLGIFVFNIHIIS